MKRLLQSGRSARHQRGQAMVEMLVSAMFFLVPLFLAIAALGKFIDVQHTAEMSARYAAWERTVWYDDEDEDRNEHDEMNDPNTKTDGSIRNEIGARLLHDRSADQVIRNNDGGATTFVNGTNVMWRDAAGTDYLAEYGDMRTTLVNETPTTDVAGEVISQVSNIGVSGVLSFLPPLPNETLAVATVNFDNVSRNSEVYRRLWGLGQAWAGLNITATGAVLSNTWAPNARDGTRDMVERMVPTAQGAVKVPLEAVRTGLATWDPIPASRMEIGKIDVDVLPNDRLR